MADLAVNTAASDNAAAIRTTESPLSWPQSWTAAHWRRKWTRCWSTTEQERRRTRRRPAPSRLRRKWTLCWPTTAHTDAGGHHGRAAGLPDKPGPGRLHNQPNHLAYRSAATRTRQRPRASQPRCSATAPSHRWTASLPARHQLAFNALEGVVATKSIPDGTAPQAREPSRLYLGAAALQGRRQRLTWTLF